MEPRDVTIEILKEIRDEIRTTRTQLSEHIDGVSTRVDGVSTRLDRLERRQVDTEVRLATELVAVAGAVNALRDAMLEDRRLRQTVEDHESRIGAIERRLPT